MSINHFFFRYFILIWMYKITRKQRKRVVPHWWCIHFSPDYKIVIIVTVNFDGFTHSWHEMGTIDLPNTIDYILEKTGEPDLSYVGHSMGTAIFFVLCSERPEYREKIRSMAAMAPIAYLSHVKSPIMTFLASVADPLAVSARRYVIIIIIIIIIIIGVTVFSSPDSFWRRFSRHLESADRVRSTLSI